MPRRTNAQMRISAAEKGRLRIDRQSQRERRRARIAYNAVHKTVSLSDPQNPVRWANP